MKINPQIFRLYDIRGVYPQDLNEKIAYQLGRSFVYFLRKTGNKKKKLRIALGKDIRFSSPALFRGFSDGVRDEGQDVIDLGLITTPMLYFAVSEFKYDGGAVITASHNPNPYNGFKLVREKAIPVSGPTGIFWLRDYLIENRFSKDSAVPPRGGIIRRNVEKIYLNFNLKLAKVRRGEFKGFSIAVDAGNGVAGPIVLKLLKMINSKTYQLYCRPDGSFPHHVPDPLIKDNLKDLISLSRKEKPDLSIALDGDGDRVVFIDEKSEAISADLITALMAKIILRENPGEKILYDVRSSNAVPEAILEGKGKPVMFKIGHALIKEKIRKDNIIFAGELAGHYYFGKKLFYDVPLFVILKILKEIKEKKTSLSKLVKLYRKYFHSGEINFQVENKEKILDKLEKNPPIDGGIIKISKIDGLRIDFKDWWFLVRPSNTEPILRLVLEAKSQKILNEKKKELLKIIQE